MKNLILSAALAASALLATPASADFVEFPVSVTDADYIEVTIGGARFREAFRLDAPTGRASSSPSRSPRAATRWPSPGSATSSSVQEAV